MMADILRESDFANGGFFQAGEFYVDSGRSPGPPLAFVGSFLARLEDGFSWNKEEEKSG